MKTPVFRLDLLREMMGDTDGYVERFLSVFQTEVPRQLEELGILIAERDWENASILAHSVKSQLKYLMADDAVTIAHTLERRALQTQDGRELEQLLCTLRDHVDGICLAIQETGHV